MVERRTRPETPRAGQESVWDFPRPPRLEPTDRHVEVVFAGEVVAETRHALRVLETSHPPVYYIPPRDVRGELLRPATGSSFCEWKGQARYHDVVVGDLRAVRAAWSYSSPARRFEPIRDHLAFFAGAMDFCRVDREIVTPQPGDFYGGWITSDLAGPFKGGPGSSGW